MFLTYLSRTPCATTLQKRMALLLLMWALTPRILWITPISQLWFASRCYRHPAAPESSCAALALESASHATKSMAFAALSVTITTLQKCTLPRLSCFSLLLLSVLNPCRMCRKHNDANVMSLGGRTTGGTNRQAYGHKHIFLSLGGTRQVLKWPSRW